MCWIIVSWKGLDSGWCFATNGSFPKCNQVFLSLSFFFVFVAAGLQCSHLLLYKHCRRVYPLPSRGVPKTGFPGDQGMHTSQAAFSKGKPAAGKSSSWKLKMKMLKQN